MQSMCLAICRFSIVAWVGAAALFVVTAVTEQTAEDFDSIIRDRLALLRFPFYYAFGFSLVIVSLVCGWLARKHPAVTVKQISLFLGLSAIALLLMIVDYVWIYQTLARLITPPGGARSSEFVVYHNASKYINEAGITCCLLAALLIGWPRRRPAMRDSAQG